MLMNTHRTGQFRIKDTLIKTAEEKSEDLLKQLNDAKQTTDKLEKSLKNYENNTKTREGE